MSANKHVISVFYSRNASYIVFKQYTIFAALHSEESIYDTPRSNRRASEREYGMRPPHLTFLIQSLSYIFTHPLAHFLPHSFPICFDVSRFRNNRKHLWHPDVCLSGKVSEWQVKWECVIYKFVYYCVIACDFLKNFLWPCRKLLCERQTGAYRSPSGHGGMFRGKCYRMGPNNCSRSHLSTLVTL